MSKLNSKVKKSKTVPMSLIRSNAAGIDIGSTFHAVAVPEGRDEPRVRTFGAMTCDHKKMVEWLKKCDVDSVAMESTGVYWKGLFTSLVENGFEVFLVNSKQIKNVSGRKNDEDDAMWIQKLHSCGLLCSSYLPEDEQQSLRTIVRYRKALTEDYSRHVLRMQKSLELMNIKVQTVISDITGKTGTSIIEAILNGERNPMNFLAYIDRRIKASRQTIAMSLEGNWRKEHLFTLNSSYTMVKFYKQEIAKCDENIEDILMIYEATKNQGVVNLNDTSDSPKENNERVTKKRRIKMHR